MFETKQIYQTDAQVVANEPLGCCYFRMVMIAPILSNALAPGQFLQLRCTNNGFDPLLRRPFSPAGVDRTQGEIELLYRVVGRGTYWLSLRRPGDTLNVVGPLGEQFCLGPGFTRIALVGRGVGIAPLLFLAKEASSLGINVSSFLSVRPEEQEFAEAVCDALRAHGSKPCVSNDPDELVTDYLREMLVCGERIDAIYVCGSRRLLREVKEISQQYDVPAQVSLETRMGCGMGVCNGCVVKVRNGSDEGWRYSRVCIEGPVFFVQEILIDE